MEKLQNISELINSCFLPTLTRNLDEIPITEENFVEYRKCLEVQLPILFDFIGQSEHWLQYHGAKNLEHQIILLLCELTSKRSPFWYNTHYLEKARVFLLSYREKCRFDDKHFLNYYEEKLTQNDWKRELGAIHGFVTFLEWHYGSDGKSVKMKSGWGQLCLSIGLKVHDLFDPLYKTLALKIFNILLSNSDFTSIQSLNIHAVIYDDIFKDIHYLESGEFTHLVLNCLHRCLDFFTNLDSLNWSYVDDIMEKLISNVTLASSSETSLAILKHIPIFCSLFSSNREEIEKICYADTIPTLDEALSICSQNTSFTCFRWAKSILEMINLESHKLLQYCGDSKPLMMQILKCYLICILPIPMPVIINHLQPFYEKFVAVLIEVFCHFHSNKPEVVGLAKDFISTFLFHIKNTYEVNKKNDEAEKLIDAFNVLLERL